MMNDKLAKPEEASFALSKGKLVSKTSTFKQRVEASKQEAVDPNTMPNRICLMLDVSGSMDAEESSASGSKKRIDLLKEAIQSFASRCDFRNTAIALKTFPGSEATKLSSQTGFIIAYSMGLSAGGGTPLRSCVESALLEVPMTRGVIVSDGGATDWLSESHFGDEVKKEQDEKKDSILSKYKEHGIPIDCVHISTTSDGEALLKRIASATEGIFIKFSDVSAFSRAFGYLAPGFRALLTSGSVDAAKLGAKEVQK